MIGCVMTRWDRWDGAACCLLLAVVCVCGAVRGACACVCVGGCSVVVAYAALFAGTLLAVGFPAPRICTGSKCSIPWWRWPHPPSHTQIHAPLWPCVGHVLAPLLIYYLICHTKQPYNTKKWRNVSSFSPSHTQIHAPLWPCADTVFSPFSGIFGTLCASTRYVRVRAFVPRASCCCGVSRTVCVCVCVCARNVHATRNEMRH